MSMGKRSLSVLAMLSVVTCVGIPTFAGSLAILDSNGDADQRVYSESRIDWDMVQEGIKVKSDNIGQNEKVEAMLAKVLRNARERYLLNQLSSESWWPVDASKVPAKAWWWAAEEQGTSSTLSPSKLDSYASEDYAAIWGTDHDSIGHDENTTTLQEPIWSDGTFPNKPRLFAALSVARRS